MSNTLIVILILALFVVLVFRQKKEKRSKNSKFSKQDIQVITDSAQRIGDVIHESMQIAGDSSNLETKISRLQVAKDKLKDLEQLMDEFPFIKAGNLKEVRRDLAKLESTIEPIASTYPIGAVEEVKHLKKEGRNREAIELLLQCVKSMEENSKNLGGVAPWYYEQLAILYRKERKYEEEVEILERYSRQPKAPGRGPEKLAERLEKARGRSNKQPPPPKTTY